ncbi:MAG: hypothetical protein WCP21_03615 [Armatimonadota bacterium]
MTTKLLIAGALVILLTTGLVGCSPRSAGTAQDPRASAAPPPAETAASAPPRGMVPAPSGAPSATVHRTNNPPLGTAAPGTLMQAPRLTPKQQQQVQQKTRELKAAGAKPAVIEATVAQMLDQWGQKLPTCLAGKPEETSAMRQWSPQQRAQLTATVRDLQAKGAKPEKVQAALSELYQSWTAPSPTGHSTASPPAGTHSWTSKLTPKQQDELMSKVKAMKAKGASGEEVRAMVSTMLQGWGVNPPDAAAPSWMDSLTPAQRDQVNAKISELKARGAQPGEIMSAVVAMLKGWGMAVE